MGSAGSVEGVAVPPGAQADQVEGGCGEDVFEVGLGEASLAGMPQAGDRMAWRIVPSKPARSV